MFSKKYPLFFKNFIARITPFVIIIVSDWYVHTPITKGNKMDEKINKIVLMDYETNSAIALVETVLSAEAVQDVIEKVKKEKPDYDSMDIEKAIEEIGKVEWFAEYGIVWW